MENEYQPVNILETDLVEIMIVSRWRQWRMRALESATLTPGNLADNSRALEFFSRYETHCDRQFSRSLKRLVELQALRAKRENRRNKPGPFPTGLPQPPEIMDNSSETQPESENDRT